MCPERNTWYLERLQTLLCGVVVTLTLQHYWRGRDPRGNPVNFDPIKSWLLRITIPDHQPLLLCRSPCPLIVSALEYSRSAVYGINYCEWPRKQLSCDSECPVPPAHPQVTSIGNRNTVNRWRRRCNCYHPPRDCPSVWVSILNYHQVLVQKKKRFTIQSMFVFSVQWVRLVKAPLTPLLLLLCPSSCASHVVCLWMIIVRYLYWWLEGKGFSLVIWTKRECCCPFLVLVNKSGRVSWMP